MNGLPHGFLVALDELYDLLVSIPAADEQPAVDALQNLGAAFGSCLQRMRDELADCAELLPVAKQQYRDRVGQILTEAAIVARNVDRPRGHHGDYETMELMYRNSFEGSTARGRLLHRMLVAGRECESVRQRRAYLSERILTVLAEGQGKKSFLSLASGPAAEWRAIPETMRERIAVVVLFDQDREALDYSVSNLPPYLAEVTTPLCRDVSDLTRGEVEQLAGVAFDYVYSAGLFDYLDDRRAAGLIRQCLSLLNRSGTFEFGNISVWPAAFFVDMVCGWRLVLRDQHELHQLIPEGTPAESTVVADQVFVRCQSAPLTS